jgi:hypothetical protein
LAVSSLGESVSGLIAVQNTKQITEEQFQFLNALAFKLEKGLLKLIKSLELKKKTGTWVDQLVVKETNAIYNAK